MFDVQTISSIISVLPSAKDVEGDTLLWQISDAIQKVGGFTFAGLFLAEADRKFVVMKAGSGWAGKRLVERGFRFAAYPEPTVKVNTVGAAVYFNQVQVLDYFNSPASPDIGESSWRLAFPLRVNDQAAGALIVEGAERMSFKIEETLGFQKVADEVSRLLVQCNLI